MDNGVEKSEIADKVQEKEILSSERKKRQAKKATVVSENKAGMKLDRQSVGDATTTEGKGRTAVDAVNQQIKQEVTSGSSYRYDLIISEWLYSSGSQPGASANFQRGKTIIKIS